jgi:hypothetical protein
MSSTLETNKSVDPVLAPFFEFWTDYFKRTNESTRQFLDDVHESANAKSWQRRWYDAVSKSVDAYLRSPVFLQAMKHNTEAAIKVKQQTDEMASEFARNFNLPLASDISGLFERLHSVEETILRRLERIDERLATIEQNFGSRKLMQDS